MLYVILFFFACLAAVLYLAHRAPRGCESPAHGYRECKHCDGKGCGQ